MNGRSSCIMQICRVHTYMAQKRRRFDGVPSINPYSASIHPVQYAFIGFWLYLESPWETHFRGFQHWRCSWPARNEWFLQHHATRFSVGLVHLSATIASTITSRLPGAGKSATVFLPIGENNAGARPENGPGWTKRKERSTRNELARKNTQEVSCLPSGNSPQQVAIVF